MVLSSIDLQNSASIQPRTGLTKFAKNYPKVRKKVRTDRLERLEREGDVNFNNYGSFKKGWTGQDVAIPETKATYYGAMDQGVRCNNCPSRGCEECPMFGVGKNPVYLKRKKEREAKKIASGQVSCFYISDARSRP